jgi:hypothetical protein
MTGPSTATQNYDCLQHYRIYSSNIFTNDLHMLESLKKHLAGKQFVTEADVKQAVTFWLQAVENIFLCWITSSSATAGQMLKCQC